MCLLDSLLGGRRRAPEDDEPRPWISRRHLLGFYPIFRIEGAADHLDPEDWISEPSLSKWRSPRGSDRISKDLSVEGIGTDVVPRDVLSSATLINALDPRGDSRAGARPPTSSAVFRPIFRIEGDADHFDPEDWIPVTCGSGIPRFSRHTQPRFHDIVNTCPRS